MDDGVVPLPRARSGDVARPILRAPFDKLHFAGEHTNYAFVGYMEGALGSGVALARAARRARRRGQESRAL